MTNQIVNCGFTETRKNKIFQGIGLGIILALGISVQYITALGFIIPALFLVVAFAILLFRHPKIWIYIAALSLPFVLWTRDSGVSVSDIVIAVIFQLNTILWLFWKICVKREKIVNTFGDWIILFFMILLLTNFAVSFFNDNDTLLWVREYALFFLMLLYMPIKYYFKDDKDIKRLLICISIGLVCTVGIHLYEFKQTAIKDAMYAYQLGTSVRLNQTIHYAAIIFALSFVFFIKKHYQKLMLLIFAFLNTLALVTSYSRTYWAILIINLLLLFICLNFKKKVEAMFYFFLMAFSFVAIVYLVVPKYTNIMFEVLEKRFVSTKDVKKDPSMQMRYIEYARAYRHIEGSELKWLYGNGLSKYYLDYENITFNYFRTSNIHNGYISFIYRFGITLSIVYYIFFIYFMFKSLWLAIIYKDNLIKPLMVGAISFFILLIVTDFTSAQFLYKETFISYSFILAFIEIADEKRRKQLESNKVFEDTQINPIFDI